MAKYLTDNVNEPALSSPDPVRPAEDKTGQASLASYRPDRRVLDLQAIEKAEVTVIGGGAVGGYVTCFLAAMASLTIHLIDPDHVDVKHTRGGRTIYEASQVNKKKVYAAKEKIERAYPQTRIVPYPFNIMDMTDGELCRLAGRSAVVINAIDDAAAMLRINALFYSIVEVMFVALHSAGATGHIALTIPYASACLRCVMGITSPDGIHTLHSEPALGADFITIANHAAIIASEIMCAKVTKKPIERWDINRNLFYFANRRDQHSPDGPGVVLQMVDKRPGCPVCSAVPG